MVYTEGPLKVKTLMIDDMFVSHCAARWCGSGLDP